MNPQVKTRKNLSATEARNLRTLLLLSVFEPQNIGNRIREARLATGLTQEEMADLAGVSTRSWQGYEAGDVVPYRHMERIAEVTRRSVAWLLHGEVEAPADREEVRRIAAEAVEDAIGEVRDLLRDLLEREQREDPPAADGSR